MFEMLAGSGTVGQVERTDWVVRMGCELEPQGTWVVGKVTCCSGPHTLCCVHRRVHYNLVVLVRMGDRLVGPALLSLKQDVVTLGSLIQNVLEGT